MNTVGRPTKLTPDLLVKAENYIYDTPDQPAAWRDDNNQVPTIEAFALYMGLSRDTVYVWSNTNSEFSDIVDDIRAQQASILVKNGLAGTFNASITKLLLTKHGYSDKVETDITTKGESITPLNTETIAKFNEFLKRETKQD